MNKPGSQAGRIRFMSLGLAFTLTALLVSGCVVVARPRPVVYAPPPAGVGVFYDALAPYGEWIIVEQYGRVWRPHPWIVGAHFEPYSTGGYWVNTEAGWSFRTQWSWGWAPFHYGRWYRDSAFGWVWVPDTTWGPAWVEWRFGGGYVGWAPLPPHGVAVVYRSYEPPWVFVPTRYLVEVDARRYAVPPSEVHGAFAVTQPLHPATGGTQWHVGPPPGQVAGAVGRPIAAVPLNATPPAPGVVRPVTVGPPHAARGGAPVPPGPSFPPGAPRGGISSSPVTPGHPSPPPGVSPGAASPPSHVPAPGSPSEGTKPPAGAPASANPPTGHPASVP